VHWPRALREYLRDKRPSYSTELLEITTWGYGQEFKVGDEGSHNAVAPWVKRLVSATGDNWQIPIRTPDWVAARLWDRSGDRNLTQLAEKWTLLGWPTVTPSRAWDESAVAAFCAAVIDAVRSANLTTWDEVDSGSMICLREEGDVRTGETNREIVPPHLLGKYLLRNAPWSSDATWDESRNLMSLVAIVAKDIGRRTVGPIPYTETSSLIELADRYPQVLETICISTRFAPELLADLLMEPAATILVVYLIAFWNIEARSESDALEVDSEQRFAAYEMAIVVLSHFMRENQINPTEVATLSIILQATRLNSDPAAKLLAERRVSLLLKALGGQSPEVQAPILSALIGQGGKGVGSSEFAALLDTMDVLQPSLVHSQATEIVAAYRQSIEPGIDLSDLSLVAPKPAKLLVDLLSSQGEAGRNLLATPFDIRGRLAGAGESATQVAHDLGRSLQAHIRVLARGISAYENDVPKLLVDALAETIRAGALDHADKGKVAAFSGFSEFLSWARPQKAIAIDLVEAVRRVTNPEHQQLLVDALLQIDQPRVLAMLYKRLPPQFSDEIRRRIDLLVPEEAGRPSTVTEVQSTVRELLAAELPEAAAKFIKFESELVTWGKAPGRAVEQYRMQLHMKLLVSDFAAILTSSLPKGLNDAETTAATLHRDFYQGLAHLQSPTSPNPERAAQIFLDLHRRHPTSAHMINLLAARRAKILKSNTLTTLAGQDAEYAVMALREADKPLVGMIKLTPDQVAIHETNRVALLLALGRNEDAHTSLQRILPEHESAESMALHAIVLARTGRADEASLILKRAENLYGAKSIVGSAIEYLKTGTAFSSQGPVIAEQSIMDRLKVAFHEFSCLDPEEQAELTHSGEKVFEMMVTKAVRNALAAVAYLAPFLKLKDDAYQEDDINAILKEILTAGFSRPYHWSVDGQSQGGYTNGNGRGERDLVIRKENSELAVIEALKFDTSGTRGSEWHFKKLPAYSSCKLFFHITYYNANRITERLQDLERIAQKPPQGITFIQSEAIEHSGTMPPGLMATYSDSGGGQVTVVFLILDLYQARQRAAHDPYDEIPTRIVTPEITSLEAVLPPAG